MPVDDAQMTRMIQREISRRYVDSSNLDVKAIHGVVYLRGILKALRGHDVNLEQELEVILRVVRSKPGIREVIADVDLEHKLF